MKVLVCGSRRFTDEDHFHEVLNLLNSSYDFPDCKISLIIEGAARGADTLAREWAQAWNVPVEEYPADWNTHGKAAGPIRNQKMLDAGKPDLVVAFLAKDSIGTRHMIQIVEKANIPVKVVNID